MLLRSGQTASKRGFIMNISYYRHFLLIGCCLLFLLAACGSGSATKGGQTPTPGGSGRPPAHGSPTPTPTLPPTQTSCPAAGAARALVTAPLSLGHDQNLVYIVNEFQNNNPTFGTLKRYDLVTG